MQYDVFNGDADGICALNQLRLETPVDGNILITGVKRDIKLLSQLQEIKNCKVTVLDVSLDSNKIHLEEILRNNNSVLYIDHHFAGEIPKHKYLKTKIVTSAETCTSLLVHEHIKGKYPGWACCGAFGDNLHAQAEDLAHRSNFSDHQIEQLREIGELLNYNGYGTSIDDLHVAPDQLYKEVNRYKTPFDFFTHCSSLTRLRKGYQSDLSKVLSCAPLFPTGKNRIYQLPDESWARRISGVFANLKAREQKTSAHALITKLEDDNIRISVRAPLNNRINADVLCKKFPTGGGRSAAGGINCLPKAELDNFIKEFNQIFC